MSDVLSPGQDLLPLMVTLLGCLLWKLEYGILLGIGVNTIEIFYLSAQAPMTYKMEDECVVITFHSGLTYPAANRFRNSVENFVRSHANSDKLIIDLSRIGHLDFTSLTALEVRVIQK